VSHKLLINNLKTLKNLESVGRPEASWVADNKEILLRQINPNNKVTAYSPTSYYYGYFTDLFQVKLLRPMAVAIMVFGVYFGYSALTLAAKASLPGEALYPIKVLSENIQLAATIGDEGKVKLKMDFISRRGDELQQLARQPEIKSDVISATVQQITADVRDVQTKIDKIATAASASTVINTVKVVDDKTLKVENDLVKAHTALPTDVKKEVAGDVKEALTQTEITGTQALTVMVAKSAQQDVKDANQAVSDKELIARVGDRIANSELAVAAAASEVNNIATGTAVILDKVTTASSTNPSVTSTLKDAVNQVSQQPQAAQDAIDQAKDLLDKKDFTSALQKIMESKNIAADVLATAPLLDTQIKIEIVSSTAATNNKSTSTATSTLIK